VRRAFLSILAITVLAGACSDGSAIEEQAGRSADTADSSADSLTVGDDPDGLAGAVGTAGDEGSESPDRLAAVATTLRLGVLSTIPDSPQSASPVDAGQLMVADLLADGLTRLDHTGAATASLAESWEHNEDATSWLFNLRPDARFSDGSPLTAGDVKRSLEAVAGNADLLAGEALSAIVGFDKAAERNQMSGLTALDDQTLQIDLTVPVGYLDRLLAMPALGVSGRDRADASSAWTVESRSANLVVLTTSENPAGDIDTIEVHRLADVDSAEAAFENGDLDLVWLGVGVQNEAATYFDGHVTAFLGSRLTSEVVGDAELRTKLEGSLDRESLVSEVFGEAAQPLWGLVPAGLTPDPITCVRDCFDRTPAEVALAERFGQDGERPTVTLDHSAGGWQADLAVSVARDLEATGLNVESIANSNQELTSVLGGDEVDFFLLGTVAQSSAPEAYLLSLFGTGASQNLTGYENPLVDSLSEVDGASVARAEQAVMADDPVFPLAQMNHSVLVGPRAEAVELHLDGTLVLERLEFG